LVSWQEVKEFLSERVVWQSVAAILIAAVILWLRRRLWRLIRRLFGGRQPAGTAAVQSPTSEEGPAIDLPVGASPGSRVGVGTDHGIVQAGDGSRASPVHVEGDPRVTVTISHYFYVDGLPQTPDPRVRASFEEGRRRVEEHDLPGAIERFRAALRDESDPRRRGALYLQIGNAQYELRRFGAAVESSRGAAEHAREAGDEEGVAAALGSQANALTELAAADHTARSANFRAALGLYRDALAISTRIGNAAQQAMTLNNLGNCLSELGRREEALEAAEEAVKIRRELAKSRPDVFLPDLAGSLNNLGNRLGELGRREEALAATEEAVKIRRELAKSRPDVFLPDLAGSLNNLGNRLGELGRREEALAATEEAVKIRRELAKSRPDVFLPDLAGSFNNLGQCLSELGRREEALTAAGEGKDIYRELAKWRPDVFLPNLAGSLNNLGAFLSELGRRQVALTAAQEASAIYRELATSRPDAFLPKLAMSLNNLGNRLSELGRREEALEAARESVQLYTGLAERWPRAFAPYLAIASENLTRHLADRALKPESEPALQRATELLGELQSGEQDGGPAKDAPQQGT